jgi:ATP-binding cassette subfamily F protein uup
MRRQPQARQTKSKARIDAFYKLEKATKPRPLDPNLALDSGPQQRIGTKILSVGSKIDTPVAAVKMSLLY